MGIADAFTLGLVDHQKIPLCIGRGPTQPEKSPLSDKIFDTDANTDKDAIFIQYPVPCESQEDADLLDLACPVEPELDSELPESAPAEMPLLTILPIEWTDTIPWEVKTFGFKEEELTVALEGVGIALSPEDRAVTDNYIVRVHPNSGSFRLIFKNPSPYLPIDDCDMSRVQSAEATTTLPLHNALGMLQKLWTAPNVGIDSNRALSAQEALALGMNSSSNDIRSQKQSYLMRVDGAKASDFGCEGNKPTFKCFAKSKTIIFSREQKVAGHWVPIFRDTGQLSLQTTAGEEKGILNLALLPRQFEPSSEIYEVIDFETAKANAEEQLSQWGPAENYKIVSSRWGYKEAPDHCLQKQLRIFYRFEFELRAEYRDLYVPRVRIEVPGHKAETEPVKCSSESNTIFEVRGTCSIS